MRKTQATKSPIDNQIYVERPYATDQEVEKIINHAAAAQADWQSLSLDKRAEYCHKAVDAMVSNRDDIAREITHQMGRPIRYSGGEISGFEERARHMISIAQSALADIVPEPKEGFERFIERVPLGVVLTIAPWNYPFLTAVNTVIPALMAGNTVILKHSAQTPLVAERFAQAFTQAGLPDGVFQYLHATHETVADMIKHPDINFVAFTGSVAGGKAIEAAATGLFKSVGLELGGKDPAYVRADANLPFSIENLVDGVYFNSGQSCCGVERIYVHEDIFTPFVEGFTELVKQYVLGNPLEETTTLGPMVKNSAATFVREQINEAIEQGAKPLIDTTLFPADTGDTPYLAPQVLVNVNHNMRIMTEESFGPVVGIQAVSSDAEALALINDSEYGLTASIWTEDKECAMQLAKQIDTGTCFMNRCDYLDPALAWVGIKNSGRGCTLSRVGYEHLTRPKSFHFRLSSQ